VSLKTPKYEKDMSEDEEKIPMIEEALRRIEVTKNERLHYLDLSGLELESIPKEVLEVPWIGALSLSNNKIEDISILAQMDQLHKLSVTNNRVEDVSVLAAMPKLRFIFLAGNKIKDITPITGQSRLKKLVLADNMITFLPDLSEFALLAYLDISGNPLKAPASASIRPQVPLLKIYKH
jgi:Leucine-rich repeat (LRR) protein